MTPVSPYVFARLARESTREAEVILYLRSMDRLAELPEGVTVTGRYPFIRAVSARVAPEALGRAAALPYVRYIAHETRAEALMDVAAAAVNRAAPEYYGEKGRGVTLAVIDTGIYPHFDFVCPKNRIKCFFDLVNGRSEPYDDNGHGTSVASAAAGNGYLSGRKYCGVAPEADVVAVKCMDSTGVSAAANVLSAMQWVEDNRRKYNIKVACMSFGAADLGFKDPFRVGATALWNSGIAVVAAAGNGGDAPGTVKSPGTAARIITVGALDDRRTPEPEDDTVAPFSGRGPVAGLHKPDILAPGVGIRVGASFEKSGEFYTTMSGTSVSTGIAAGLCCLIAAKYDGITPDEIKALLLKRARPVTGDPDAEGAGEAML